MIARRITLAFAATVSALALRHDSARAAQIAPAIAARIDFVVEDAMTDAVTPGASIAIERDGAIIYAKGYGRSDRRDTPVTPASVFAMGSITKQFVAAAILQLSDAGKVNLDAPVGTYLPMFSAQRDLTVRNLLRQSSGLLEFNTIPYILNERIIYSAGHVDRTPLLVAIAAQPLRFRPGAQFMYSNTNYLLLSEIVSRVTHTPYEAYLRSHVFSRAGLTQTFAGKPGTAPSTEGFRPIYGYPVHIADADDNWSAGAGSLHSTPGDLLRWDDALFGGKVISKGALIAMTTPYKASYAFGLVVGKLGEHESIWHNGATVNAHSMLIRYVPQRLTIAVAGNTEGFPAELVAARSARIVSATLPPLDPRAFPEPHLRRNGLAGLIGVFLPLLTLLIAHGAWWRWVLAPLVNVLLAAAGVIAPLYAGIAGLVIALLLLITPLRAVASRRRTPSDLSAAQH